MSPPVEGRVPFRGHETWYRIVGDGDGLPLVLLHGGPGSTHLGLSVLGPLADERPVVFYDQLGCGNSSRPSDPSLWTVELFVGELVNLREALGLDRIHLLGHSWGGMLALEYALTRPPGLESLVLSSTLSSAALWEEEAMRLRSELPPDVLAVLEAHEAAGTVHDPEYEEATKEYYRRHLCRLDPWPPIVEELLRVSRKEVYETMWGPNEMRPTGTLSGWDVTHRLGEIEVPTLVLCGHHDEATPRQAATIAHGLGGESELVVLEHSAHLTPLEETDRYLELVRAFLHRIGG
ncbi:MAG TPA: proline iminopeptidase-family hydrolase [Gaiellaceae bacterium]|nr:proline iminopeptidase-family hydrolase [Gaiellaceae bacterium]